jgi:hypothetical protein
MSRHLIALIWLLVLFPALGVAVYAACAADWQLGTFWMLVALFARQALPKGPL